MYAIVKTGGKQYRVEPGQRLLVERLPAEVGATVALEPLLYRSDELITEKAALARVTVSATVVAHERGEKLRVFKFKPKRGYRRRAGHRQELSRIEVREIRAGGGARGARAAQGEEKAAPARAPKGAAGTGGQGAAGRGSRSASASAGAAKGAGAGAARKKPEQKEAAADGS
jgi:large subunit ribosomal protein L21